MLPLDYLSIILFLLSFQFSLPLQFVIFTMLHGLAMIRCGTEYVLTDYL